MTFLLLQIALYLGLVFLLGLALGWALWGRGRRQAATVRGPVLDGDEGASPNNLALADALARVNQEKSELARRLTELEKS